MLSKKVNPFVEFPKENVGIVFTLHKLGEKYGYVKYKQKPHSCIPFFKVKHSPYFHDPISNTNYDISLVKVWRYATYQDKISYSFNHV